MDIERRTKVLTVTIANGASLSSEIDISGFSTMHVQTPASWTDANIGFHGASSLGGTFMLLKKNKSDVTGSVPVQIAGIATSAAAEHVAPDEVFGCLAVKLFSKSTTEATETAVNQDGARTLTVILKT